MTHKRFISVDELRAAGALDVPPEWRKSLGGSRKSERQRDLFSELEDEDASALKQESAADDADDDQSEDEPE